MNNYQSVSEIAGVFLLKNFYMEDLRGSFIKTFQRNALPAEIADLEFREVFVTTSRKNVVRGMHFQRPPYDIAKLVTVLSGKVLDVVFDMRPDSPDFKKCFSVVLGEGCEYRSIFVPTGCAHGFLALRDNSIMMYQSTMEFAPDYDTGIRFDSIDFEWPVEQKDIIISEKDRLLPPWDPAKNPFL